MGIVQYFLNGAWYYLKVFFGLYCFVILLSAFVRQQPASLRVVQPNNTRRQNEEHERLLNGHEHQLEQEEERRRRATHLTEQLRIQQEVELARRQRVEDERRRLQQKQDEQRRQQEQHLIEQLRARQEAAEVARRQRLEDERLQQQQQQRKELEDALIEEIDYFIRTRSRFDSREPLLFEVYLHVIIDDSDVVEAFRNLREHYSTILNGFREYSTIKEFINVRGSSSFQVIAPNNGHPNQSVVKVKTLTPFQGDATHRVFGEFKCGSCGRCWSSASTWTNKWQKCGKCDAKCYPYYQHILRRDLDQTDGTSRKPHHMDRCERCIELGKLCCSARYYAV